jgi:hypothetical protein
MTRLSMLFAFVGFVSGCGILPSSSGGTSGGSCAPECNGDKTGCPMLGANLTALGSLHAAQPLAQKILGAAPRWMGVFEGLKITRQGLPSPDPEIVDVLGQQTKVYVSGWVFKYCAGMNDVAFGAGPQTSTAQRGCNDINCDAMTDTAEPAVDSAAAIAAAFPGDPADALYNVEFAVPVSNNQRVWSITKRPSGPTVKVDADSGALVP